MNSKKCPMCGSEKTRIFAETRDGKYWRSCGECKNTYITSRKKREVKV